MRKKILCASMCVAMAASALVGCGSDKKGETTTNAPASDDAEADPDADADADAQATGGKVF